MVSLDRKSNSPMVDISNPSIYRVPSHGSDRRNSARTSVVLPAPVLPVTPNYENIDRYLLF